MTLTEFLTARIAEDEAAAALAAGHGGPDAFERDDYGRLLADPSRVRAECEAKRRIVESTRFVDDERSRVDFLLDHHGQDYEGGTPGARDHYEVFILKVLAAAYNDHADYNDAWRV